MKKVFAFLSGSLLCLGAVFLFMLSEKNHIVAASGTVTTNQSFAEQVQALSEAINKFSDALEPAPVDGIDPSTASSGASNTVEYRYADCVRDYPTWNKSYTRDEDADWTMYEFYTTGGAGSISYVTNQLSDINGDGLPDYVYNMNGHYVIQPRPSYGYKYSSYSGNTIYVSTESSCVMINTGKGWEEAYKCVAMVETDYTTNKQRPVFYGDCAQM